MDRSISLPAIRVHTRRYLLALSLLLLVAVAGFTASMVGDSSDSGLAALLELSAQREATALLVRNGAITLAASSSADDAGLHRTRLRRLIEEFETTSQAFRLQVVDDSRHSALLNSNACLTDLDTAGVADIVAGVSFPAAAGATCHRGALGGVPRYHGLGDLIAEFGAAARRVIEEKLERNDAPLPIDESASLRLIVDFGPTHLRMGLRHATTLLAEEAKRRSSNEKLMLSVLYSIAIVGIVTSYVFVFLRMITDIRAEERRTKGMLLLIPAEVIATNFNIREYLVAADN
jgi:hypothetical protein